MNGPSELTVYNVTRYVCLRGLCALLGAVNNPHNEALAAGYRCPKCGTGRDGTIILSPRDPEDTK